MFFGIGVALTLVSANLAGQVNILWIVALILLALGNIVLQLPPRAARSLH